MGDAAIDKLLDIYEKVTREEGLDLTAQRNIINHASAVRLDQLPRIKKSGLLVSFYPAAGSQWYERYIHRLGEERAALTNPMRSAIEQGIVVTAHNDAPIIDPDPFIILWSAVNRRSVYTDTLWGPQERISVKEALRTVTINAAIQYRQENIKGSIEPGKQADLIILSHNPLAIDPIELKDVKVLETIKDGQSVYNA
jgi:predicted amidohydrolase YtcJ